MNRKHLWIWGPPLFATAITVSLLQRFIDEQVTSQQAKIITRNAQQNMPWANRGYQSLNNELKNALIGDTLTPVSPFHSTSRSSNSSSSGSRATASPIVRPTLILKGTVGNEVATVMNGMGNKWIVRVGERIDSAEVMRIGPGKVTFKDRHGQYELESQP